MFLRVSEVASNAIQNKEHTLSKIERGNAIQQLGLQCWSAVFFGLDYVFQICDGFAERDHVACGLDDVDGQTDDYRA